MKPQINKYLFLAVTILGMIPTVTMGQIIQTDDFSITNDGDENLIFNDYTGSLSTLEAVNITLMVSGLHASGNFQGTDQNPTVPQATFTDTISLHNTNYPPANLIETDHYTGSAPLAQNGLVNFSADNFIPIPNTSSSTITPNLQNADLANFVGNGHFTQDVVTQMIDSDLVGANIPNSSYTITGTVTVAFEAAPEPSSESLVAIGVTVLIAFVLGSRSWINRQP